MANKSTTAIAVLHIISGTLLAAAGTTLFVSGIVQANNSN